jgi:hypothetical protein
MREDVLPRRRKFVVTTERCAVCLGEGLVPVFEDRDGIHMPVGYRPCDCMAGSDNLVEVRTETVFR